MWKSFKKNFYLLPVFSGLILTISFFIPNLFLILFFFLIPFFIFLEACQTKKEAFKGGFLMGLSYLLPTMIIGLFPSDEFFIFAKNYVWLNTTDFFLLTSFLLLAPFISLFYGFWGVFVFQLFKKNNYLNFLIIPSSWIIVEFLKRKIFFDLSWGDLGYNFINYLPLVITAKLWGKYGLAFFVILINFLFYLLLTKKLSFKFGLIFLILILGGLHLIGFYLIKNTNLSQGEKIKIAVLQGYIPWSGETLFVQGPEDPFYLPYPYDNLIEQIKKTKLNPDIILLPEEVLHFNPLPVSSYSSHIEVLSQNYYWLSEKEKIRNILEETGARVFIIGQPTILNNQISGNSFLIFDNQGNLASYTKKRLFPFVERYPIYRRTDWAKTGYQPGKDNPLIKINNLNLFLISCIEIENDGLLNKYLTNEPSVILSGGSEIGFNELARKYQLQLARFRAIEQDKYLARATKRGFSAIINPLGKTVSVVKNSNQDAVLFAKVYLRDGKTLYSKIGDLPLIILGWLLIAYELIGLKIVNIFRKLQEGIKNKINH